jgi:hypothetical protein
MAAKTKATKVSPASFINALPNPQRRKDAKALVAIMRKATGAPPKMWGPSIIGFGTRSYPLAGGREGTMCLTGFSPRKPSLVLYIGAALDDAPLMAKLGAHTRGKGCLYIKKLDDVDRGLLEKLIKNAIRTSTGV